MKNKQKTDTNVLLTTLAIQAVSVPEQIQEVPVKDNSKEVDWSIDTVGIVHEECMIKDEIKLDNDVVTVKEEPESDDFDIVDVVPQTLTNKGPILEFDDLKEKVLVLKVCKDKLVMATESGEIYIYNITTGTREATVKVTKLPITSLVFKKFRDSKPYLFVGSCESSLKVYNLYSTFLLRSFYLEDSVQCMDEKWGYLFLGCLRGTIIRYSIKKEQLEHQEQFSSNPVLVLRATVEGARKVLLIGSRDSPVIVRDAMNGLLLRKLNIIYPTVYSMVTHNHYVICGTKACDILLFNFHNGNLEHTFKATAAKGVACMKVVGKCLFASCYNGNIYVFNLETKTLVDKMCGPGGVIISMEVLTHQVIVGTLSFKIGSIPITQTVLSQMR